MARSLPQVMAATEDWNEERQRNRWQCVDILHEQKKSVSGGNEKRAP